jgi:hypothetical protein
MGMTEAGDGDAADEVEVLRPVGGEEIGALAPLESELGPGIGRQNGWDHEKVSCAKRGRLS